MFCVFLEEGTTKKNEEESAKAEETTTGFILLFNLNLDCIYFLSSLLERRDLLLSI